MSSSGWLCGLRLNSLDNIYSAYLVRFVRCSFANTLFSRHLLVILSASTCIAYTNICRKALLNDCWCDCLLIYKRYVINPRYPVIHWTFCRMYRRSLFRIITNANCFRSILLWHFDRTLLMSANHIKHCLFSNRVQHYRSPLADYEALSNL